MESKVSEDMYEPQNLSVYEARFSELFDKIASKSINQLEIAALLLEINNVLSKVIDDPNAYIGRETFF